MQTHALIRSLADRPWSRAGAVAQAMRNRSSIGGFGIVAQLAMLVVGTLLIAAAVATMLWNAFGPGPLDVFVSGFSEATGMPLALAYWCAFAVTLALVMALGRRPGPGTILTPLILGPAVQFILAGMEEFDRPGHDLVRVLVQVLAIGLAGIGAGLLIESGLGAGTGELLAIAGSDRTGRREPHVRMAFESTWLVFGVLLGGPVGVGTVIVAALIGPSVANGHRFVRSLLERVHRDDVDVRIPTEAGAPAVSGHAPSV
jgi:uncharacterized protein